MPESMGILHPGTSFGVFWSTNVARTWYRNERYPLIPEKPGIRRGIRLGRYIDNKPKISNNLREVIVDMHRITLSLSNTEYLVSFHACGFNLC